MKTSTKIIISAAAVLVIAVIVVCLFVFGVFEGRSELPQYAPEGTDVIVYVNGRKIAGTKAFAAFKKTAAYGEMAGAARRKGLDIDKVFQGEACVFFDFGSVFRHPAKVFPFTVIYRGSQAETLFELSRKNTGEKVEKAEAAADKAKAEAANNGREYVTPTIPKFSADKIDGKPAFVMTGDANVAAILLDKDLVQYSVAGDKSKLIDTPLKKKKGTRLTKAVDTSALISIAWKVDIPQNAAAGKGKNPSGDIVTDLEIVSLHVYESGDDLRIKLVGSYRSIEKAKAAQESVIALRKLARERIGDGDKELADVLKALEISQSGNKVTISLKYGQDDFVKLIEKMNNAAREARQKARERQTRRQEEYRERSDQ